MNHSIACLHEEELGRLLSGEVDAARTSELEQHLANCIVCRQRLEQQVGDDGWWNETESSLRSQNTAAHVAAHVAASLRDAEDVDHDVGSLGETRLRGTRLRDKLFDLLGPTDDHNMLGRIGPYEIIGLLGQGGMGAVFKGFDRSLNRFVAIKMLLPHLAASGAARKRFAREGQAVAAVVDDHVMAIHCVDEWQGVPYLVMTYSRGVSLQKRLSDNGPLEVREILRIGMQAAKGLAAAHAQGIVHRDIKPANIFLDQNVERVQLMDFGLARAVDDASLTRSGTLAGTPQYMSPEQARAETVDHRSDLFSLGSVMYAMCTGHAPFRAESSYSVLRLITDKEPRPIREINPDVPEWLGEIISKLMSKSPDDRYASANEVATLLEKCLAHLQDPLRHVLPVVIKEFGNQSKFKRLIFSNLIRGIPIMNDKRIVSLISLILMLMALLGPWPIASLGNLESALAFSASAALLSLGLALFSRSEYFSRIVLWGFGFSIGLCLVGIAVSVPIFFYRSAVLQAREAQVEQMRAEVAARDALALAHARTEQEKAIRETHSEKDATRTDNGNGEPIAVVMVMHPAELRNGNSIQRAAATKTLGLLTDKDYCGVLSYGQVQGEVATNWLWGKGSALESVGQHRKDWNAAIAKSTSGDFPEFRSAFQMALSAMKEVNANQKAMIVFTDGDPVFDDESFIDKFRDAGIKVSVIHVDIHAINRRPLLQRIVDATGGAYHYVLESQAAVVEKLFEREVQSLRVDTSSSLKKIGLAFQLIQEKTGSFPGSRMKYLDRRNTEFEHPFSWRVAILPYIGQQQLFDDYRFDEPWDSSNNISLLNRIPDVYRSSYAPADQPLGNSNMLGFACENGGLGSHSGEKLSSFTDGTSNTILIVESSQSVPWTKPEDLTELNDQSFAGQPLRFVLADGSVSQMSPIDSVKLEKMITRNGGEVVTDHPNKETN